MFKGKSVNAAFSCTLTSTQNTPKNFKIYRYKAARPEDHGTLQIYNKPLSRSKKIDLITVHQVKSKQVLLEEGIRQVRYSAVRAAWVPRCALHAGDKSHRSDAE